MSVAGELHTSLRSMGFVQLLLAIVFLAAYTVACSPLFGALGRWRAAGLAIASAGGFTAFTSPWEHGVMLVACAVGGLGLFSAIGWALSRMLDLRNPRLADAGPAPVEDAAIGPAPAVAPPITPATARVPAA